MLYYLKRVKDPSHINVMAYTEDTYKPYDDVYLTIHDLDKGIHKAYITPAGKDEEVILCGVDEGNRVTVRVESWVQDHVNNKDLTRATRTGVYVRVLSLDSETELCICLFLVWLDGNGCTYWLEEMPIQTLMHITNDGDFDLNMQNGTSRCRDARHLPGLSYAEMGEFLQQLVDFREKLEKHNREGTDLMFGSDTHEFDDMNFLENTLCQEMWYNEQCKRVVVVEKSYYKPVKGKRINQCMTGDGPIVDYIHAIQQILDLSLEAIVSAVELTDGSVNLILNFENECKKYIKIGYNEEDAFLLAWKHVGIPTMTQGVNSGGAYRIVLDAKHFNRMLEIKRVSRHLLDNILCFSECLTNEDAWLDSETLYLLFDLKQFIQQIDSILSVLSKCVLYRNTAYAVSHDGLYNGCLNFCFDLIDLNENGIFYNYLTDFKIVRLFMKIRVNLKDNKIQMTMSDDQNVVEYESFVCSYLENSSHIVTKATKQKGKQVYSEGVLKGILEAECHKLQNFDTNL